MASSCFSNYTGPKCATPVGSYVDEEEIVDDDDSW